MLSNGIFLSREYLSQLLELRKILLFFLFTGVSIFTRVSILCPTFQLLPFLRNLSFFSSLLFINLHRTGKMAQWSSSCLVKTTHRIIFSLLIPFFLSFYRPLLYISQATTAATATELSLPNCTISTPECARVLPARQCHQYRSFGGAGS